MPTIQNKLFGFRDYSEHEVLNMFSLNGTGLAGTFVSFVSNDPSNTDGWSNQTVGASYDGVTSLRYEVKSKVQPAPAGSTKFNVAGLTLMDTREVDNNGLLLKFNPQRKAELQCVLSGEATPILKRGLVTLARSAFLGTPTVGAVGVIDASGNGIIRAVDPTNVAVFGPTGTYKPDQAIGRFISSTGSEFGGYAIFEINV